MMEIPQTTNNNHTNKQRKKKKKASDPNTLFVKFTPPSPYITRHHLSNYFSNWGPVNKCSVIRNKTGGGNNKQQQTKPNDDNKEGGEGGEAENQDRGTKGYGFVRFVNVDDAISAAQAIKEQNNSQLKKGMTVDGILYKIHAERAVDAAVVNNNNVQKKENSSKDTDEEKEDIDKVTPPPQTKSPTTTPTSLSKEEEQTKYKTESKRKRTSRVIIRNLSFYANQTNITQVMEDLFGPVSVVDLPLVPNNNTTNNNTTPRGADAKGGNNVKRGALTRHRGFAFVTFTNLNAAKMAVEYDKEVRIKNRIVAIDFSISKVEHQRLLKEEKDGKSKEEESSDSDSSEREKGSDGEESNSDSSDDDDDDDSSSSSEEESDSESDSEDEEKDSDDDKKDVEQDTEDDDKPPPEDQFTTSNESKRTLFLRNIPFDATRHDVFELFRKFGRIEGVYLVKDKVTGVFKGTAFVRFENEEGCMNAMDEATDGGGGGQNEDGTSQFVSSKNMTMSGESESSLTLKGRTILLDLAVDRTTASSLAIQRDEDGKPIKKMVGKDKRNLYLKNEGRVSSSTDSGHAQEASAKHGGLWEDLPMSDRAKRERAFADKSTKLRSPLFFINPNRISIRNLNKEVNESQLKSLVFGALKLGIEEGLVTPKDAVSQWRAGGELPHAEVMRRATDPKLVTPPIDEKNMKESVVSVFIDRDVSGGKKTADAPSRGFGFVEFTHHTHALAVLRRLNNNPMYSREYVAGGKHAGEMSKQKRKKGKGKKNIDNNTGDEFMNDDGKGLVPRLIVEFAVENKVKARQQAEKVAQKKANKIKQRIEKKEKQQEQKASDDKKEKKKGRGALQREKKRKRKEAGEDDKAKADEDTALKKKQKLSSDKIIESTKEKKQKLVKPKKKRKVDTNEEALEDMIRSYKSTFSQGGDLSKGKSAGESKASESKTKSREQVVKKRWFE